MKRLRLLCLVLVHLHAGAAPAGAILLWPGASPGGAAPGPQRDSAKGSITQVEQPYLIVHRPAQPNGTAIVLVSGGGYRRHSDAFKRAVVAQSLLSDASVSRIARQHNLNANQVFAWRKLFGDGLQVVICLDKTEFVIAIDTGRAVECTREAEVSQRC